MSDKVDLALVELRAKLRGWEFWLTDDSGDEAFVVTPGGGVTFRPCGALYDGRAEPYAERLTRPRLTLADIVAHPPEGWRVRLIGHSGTSFARSENGECDAEVGHWPGEPPTSFVRLRLPIERQVAAHRAIADLLVLLGEVEP